MTSRSTAAKFVTALAVAVCLLVDASGVAAERNVRPTNDTRGRNSAAIRTAPNPAALCIPNTNRLRPVTRIQKKTSIALFGAPAAATVLAEARCTALPAIDAAGAPGAREGSGRSPPLA